MPITEFADLPVVEEPWDPQDRGMAAILDDILGPDGDNWDRMKRAHLWWDGEGGTRASYKLPFARMVDGELKAFFVQVARAVAAVQGARGGVKLPPDEKRRALTHAKRYYDKAGKEFPVELTWQAPVGAGPLIRAMPIKLTAVIDEAADPRAADREGFCVWNQLAIEGEYKGHPTGDFYLGREEMEQIISNFRAHPCYEPDPGKRRPIVTGEDQGHGQVIPFDYHHASEEPASVVAVSGAPAQSWAHDMAIRLCPETGQLELWGLVEFLEPAKTFVKEGKYRFTSIAFWPNAKDPRSGKDIGCYVSSIAFTNDPFIQGMAPLAAARKPAELVTALKNLLQLPETATESEVLEAVQLGRAATDPAPGATGVAQTQPSNTEKLMPHLLTRIASALGVQIADDATEPQQAAAAERILVAVTKLQSDRDDASAARQQAEAVVANLAEALGVQASGLAEGVVALKTGREKAMEALNALATALGVEDASAATAKVAELLTASSLLQEVMPALSALQEPATAQVEEDEEMEVMAAMRHYLHPDQHEAMKPALLNMLRGGVTVPKLDPSKGATQFSADCKAMVAALQAKKAAREGFRKQYPLPQADQQHLLQSYATQPAGGNHGQPTVLQMQQAQQPAAQGPVDLSRYPGRNSFEQLMSFVRHQAHQNGEGELDYNVAYQRAKAMRHGLPAQY